jgi:glycolate oxidase FAD binding subunit
MSSPKKEFYMPKADKFVSRLQEIAGKAAVIQDRDKLEAYALDGKRPKVIVSPRTMDEVSKVIAYANQQRMAVIPMGNGTKIGIGGVPKKIDIVLLTRRLNRITDCDIDNLTFSAESGMTLNEVQKHLAKEGRGYFLPLDPFFADKATLGGIVATNSSGPKRLLYGTARDLIIGMKTVFPNGDIVVSGGKTVKNVSGYDMCKLLIGSFGTLGIICEITFKILPLPEKEATLLVPFKALDEADGFVQEVSHSQLVPASIETLNATAVTKMKCRFSLPGEGKYVVAIGLEGVAESVERQISALGNVGEKHGALQSAVLNSLGHQGFWNALRNFSEGLAKRYPDLIALKSNFLISKCGKVIESYEKIFKGMGMDFAFICHSGNGILYSYVLADRNVRSKTETFVKLIKKLTSEAVKNEGNLVVESSPFSIRKKVDVWGKSRTDRQVMRRIKKEVDPAGVLNPGRFLGGI